MDVQTTRESYIEAKSKWKTEESKFIGALRKDHLGWVVKELGAKVIGRMHICKVEKPTPEVIRDAFNALKSQPRAIKGVSSQRYFFAFRTVLTSGLNKGRILTEVLIQKKIQSSSLTWAGFGGKSNSKQLYLLKAPWISESNQSGQSGQSGLAGLKTLFNREEKSGDRVLLKG